MIEIERKYLVNSKDYRSLAFSKSHIVQGFLNSHPDRVVRIRIADDKAFLTVKGRSNSAGTTRFEWEKEIPTPEAKLLLELCEKEILEKIRYFVRTGTHIIEVDEFLGSNQGLVIAEIEFEKEEDNIEVPSWVGLEVTGDIKYYNSQLSKSPFKEWKV
ncbi:CYTH domain-containing protein [uncultured Eudoraea sp.]|uniref:CYTH domain-containing protein n=1 Tax=uncultured Eudoraea sp. TaxID=1035614 RepID=UPI002622E7CD|nr:CYTH domain-containing protein [uncultured Eudoraea sp.]